MESGVLALVCFALSFLCWVIVNRSARPRPEVAIGSAIAGSLFLASACYWTFLLSVQS